MLVSEPEAVETAQPSPCSAPEPFSLALAEAPVPPHGLSVCAAGEGALAPLRPLTATLEASLPHVSRRCFRLLESLRLDRAPALEGLQCALLFGSGASHCPLPTLSKVLAPPARCFPIANTNN